MISSLALANTHTHHLLLRCHIFSCTCTMMGCSFMTFLALAQSWTHAHLMLSYDIFSCTCIILHTHTHLMLRYDIFPGTESTNGFLGTIWQSDNWPTTWKNGNRQIKLFVVKSSKHIIHEVHKWGVFVHWSQKRKGARIPVTMFKAMLWRLAPISDLSFRFVPK